MKFISVRRLAAVLKLEVSRTNDELIHKLKQSVEQYFLKNQILNAFGQDFTQQELIFILNQLKEENIPVFHEWIEEDRLLVEYLFSSGEIILENEDVILSKENDLFESYQNFLETYLAPILSKKLSEFIKEGNLAELGNHLRFSPLLAKKKRIEIQQAVVSYLRQSIAQLKVSHDQELQKQLKLVFSPEFVQLLNELDESFYADSIKYFDTARLVVQRNDLSLLVLDRIKSTILSLNLNKEDHQKVVDFSSSNAFRARVKKPNSRINEMVKSPFFIVAVIVVLVNFIFLDSEGEVEINNSEEKVYVTSYLDDNQIRDFPFLIDTFNLEITYKILQEASVANYRPLYIGVKNDTLDVNYNLSKYYAPPPDIEVIEIDLTTPPKSEIEKKQTRQNHDKISEYFKDFSFEKKCPDWYDSKIKITIGTTQKIRNVGSKKYEDTDFIYEAYPVILENTSDSTIIIGYGSQIPLILELKDESGEWKATETMFTYMCGNGLPSILLPKGEIVLTSVPVMKVEKDILFRLKIGKNYSEVFGGEP
jgi:hypothetical protein